MEYTPLQSRDMEGNMPPHPNNMEGFNATPFYPPIFNNSNTNDNDNNSLYPMPALHGFNTYTQPMNDYTMPSAPVQLTLEMVQANAWAMAQADLLALRFAIDNSLGMGVGAVYTAPIQADIAVMPFPNEDLLANLPPTEPLDPQPTLFNPIGLNQDTPDSGNSPFTFGYEAFPSSATTPVSSVSSPPAHAAPAGPLSPNSEAVKQGGDNKGKLGRCPVCPKTTMAVRDIERHLWTNHKGYAEALCVKSELRSCPMKGCKKTGRRDNISRHYRLKHGGEIKWKNGVAHVV